MPWTKKEQSLLKDLQKEEKLCVEKYHKAAEQANEPALKDLLASIETAEERHYSAVTEMLTTGETPSLTTRGRKKQASPKAEQKAGEKGKITRAEKQSDRFLLNDLLGTEKYVSAVYNTSVFEFADGKARQLLSGIQQQEQGHGKQITDYMAQNDMN